MSVDDVIEARIRAGDWRGARRRIKPRLRNRPNSHWLLTRIGLTYYEQRRYQGALVYETRVYELAPHCPLVLWDLAGTLDMLGREREAIALYEQIAGRTIPDLAHGQCGEGKKWARGLVADAYYRTGHAWEDLGDRESAASMYRRALKRRRGRVASIYSGRLVKRALKRVR